MTSFTSVGVVRTPEGKAVVDRPSLVGRAPVPPLKIGLMTNGVAEKLPPGTPVLRSTGFQMHDAPLRRRDAGARLVEAAEHDVRQHLTQRVASGYGCRELGVENAARRVLAR